MKLVIDRTKWARGGGEDEASFLLRTEDNKMCCLGFYCLAQGVSQSVIANVFSPGAVCVDDSDFFENLKKLVRIKTDGPHNNDICNKMMEVNDVSSFGDDVRETKLTKLFEKIDIDVEFVN